MSFLIWLASVSCFILLITSNALSHAIFAPSSTDDGRALVRLPNNERVGYYYDTYIGDNGELLVVDGNNTVFSASMNDNGTLSDYDGATWFDID